MNFLKWFGYLALCAAFIWFVFFRPLSSNSAEISNTNSELNEGTIDENSTIEDINDIAESSDYSTDNTSDESIDEQSSNTSNDVAESNPSNNTSADGSINLDSKYLIVVGSFGNKANADRMLRRVKSDGKEGKMTLIRGLHRIVTASTNDQADAKNLRDHFTHIYKEQAFILKQ